MYIPHKYCMEEMKHVIESISPKKAAVISLDYSALSVCECVCVFGSKSS